MRNLIIGDVHGHFRNLREVLLHFGAINEMNERINKDTLRVYCTGDLIDGGVNRQGDLLILDYAEEWFDEIVIGNHELPFFGGPNFKGLRQHDRELRLRLHELEAIGKYVPSTVVDGYLLTHAGLADYWSFQNVEDCNDVIRMVWRDAEDTTKEIPLIDWIGPTRSGKFADPCGGVFWCDWDEDRNKKVNQIVGHSTLVYGPVVTHYDESDHWNIDVGGKYGCCLGGVILEEGDVNPFFWGQRVVFVDDEKILTNEDVQAVDEGDDWADEDETSMWREMMESH